MKETLTSISNISKRIMEKMGVNSRATKAFWQMGSGEKENVVFSLIDYSDEDVEKYCPSFISIDNETQVMTFFYDGIPYFSDKLSLVDLKRIRAGLLKLERNRHKIERIFD